MTEHGFPCPTCGSADVRRSRRQDISEIPKMLLGVYPFRCLGCGERFLGNVWRLSRKGFAKCPKCLRLSVLPWERKETGISALDQIKMRLGAHTYRCLICRHTFVSFCKSVVSGQTENVEDSNVQQQAVK